MAKEQKNFNILGFVGRLTALGERQGRTARTAARLIRLELAKRRIPSELREYSVRVPHGSASLAADGRRIPCRPSSFLGGTVSGQEALVSSLIPSRFLIRTPNINFNPLCRGISRSNFYFAPAIAIHRGSLPAIMRARNIRARVRVTAQRFRIPHILVGNRRNPATLVFAHYDSIGPGATDNASGVATSLATIFKAPGLLRRTLFVFDGNEELSYDAPTYWGRGFRVFERRHKGLMRRAKRIIVVDCVGNGPPRLTRNRTISYLSLPIQDTALFSKVLNLCADVDRLMRVYHSDLDTLRELRTKHLRAARDVLIRTLSRGTVL